MALIRSNTYPTMQDTTYVESNGLHWAKESTPAYMWIDCETTGLSRTGGAKVLEVAAVLTDNEGGVIPGGVFHALVFDFTHWLSDVTRLRDSLNEFVLDMHTQNGLLRDILQMSDGPDWYGMAPESVKDQFISWTIDQKLIRGELILAGSTIEYDRAVIEHEEYINEIADFAHYRSINVSTLKELCRRLNYPIFKGWKDEEPAIKPHRALEDVAASIKEFRYYKDEFLFVAGPVSE